jgi:hypothetical protein
MMVAMQHRIRRVLTLSTVLALTGSLVSTGLASAAASPWQLEWNGVGTILASPLAVDLDGDGTDEILLGSLDGHLRALNANGTVRWDTPIVTWDGAGPTGIESTPAVSDLNGDGRPEIVIGAGSMNRPNQHGGLVVLDANGTVLWKRTFFDIFSLWSAAWGTRPDGFTEAVIASPALGDVDGDGVRDIVVSAMDNRVWAFKADGSVIPGFPVWVDDAMWSSPVLADADGDGRSEIIAGMAASPGGSVDHRGGVVMLLDWQQGVVRQRWEARVQEAVSSTPAIGDINGDGRPEVVFGTGLEFRNADTNSVFAVDLATGAGVAGWPVRVGGFTRSSPALGDVNADGRTDVVITSGDGRVNAIDGSGRVLWSMQPAAPGEGAGEFISSPVLVDVDGNGGLDVVSGNGWGLFWLRGSDGGRLRNPSPIGWTFQNAATVARTASGPLLVAVGFLGNRTVINASPVAGTSGWMAFGGSTTRGPVPCPGGCTAPEPSVGTALPSPGPTAAPAPAPAKSKKAKKPKKPKKSKKSARSTSSGRVG